MALQPREISQAISCIISIKQTGDLKFASGDYISPVGWPEDFFNFEPWNDYLKFRQGINVPRPIKEGLICGL